MKGPETNILRYRAIMPLPDTQSTPYADSIPLADEAPPSDVLAEMTVHNVPLDRANTLAAPLVSNSGFDNSIPSFHEADVKPEQKYPLTQKQYATLHRIPERIRASIGHCISNEMKIYNLAQAEGLTALPLTSNRRLAEEHGISNSTIRLISKDALFMKDYHERVRALRLQGRNHKVLWNGQSFHSYEEAGVGDTLYEYLGFELINGETFQVVAVSENGKTAIGDFRDGRQVIEYHDETIFNPVSIFAKHKMKFNQYTVCLTNPAVSKIVTGEYKSFSIERENMNYGLQRWKVFSNDPDFQDIEEIVVIPFIKGKGKSFGRIRLLSLYEFIKSHTPDALKKDLPDEATFAKDFRKKVALIKEENKKLQTSNKTNPLI